MAQSKKNILYISYDGMTDNLGQSQVLPYVVGLSKLGYRFTIISCEKKERYSRNRQVVEDICTQNKIDWHPLFYTKKPPILSTVLDVMAISRKAKELHKELPFDMVHSRSYLSAIVAMQLKRKYGVKFLFDMRGLWADERVDGGQWNLKNPVYNIVYKYFKIREKEFLEEADYTICLTDASKNEIHRWGNIKNNPVKIDVIPCCADTTLFDPAIISQERSRQLGKELGINQSEFVLTYLGGIGLWYLLEEMLDFFQVLLKYIPAAKFLFISGDDKNQIFEAGEKRNIPAEKIIVCRAQREEVPLYISLCNASIFFIKPSYSKISSSPTKQGELMAMGKPVFCNAGVGDTDSIVKKYNSGIVINDFSDEEYEKAISDFLNKHFDKQIVREGAIDYFDLEMGIIRYNSVYKKILD